MLSAQQHAFSACSILTSEDTPANNIRDGIGIILSSNNDCPKNVFEFRKQIQAAGLTIKTTMVANRGYHNPSEGSFSFFEIVTGQLNSMIVHPGDFFFGHFTTVDENDELTADQGPTDEPRLMIEAFAWDTQKKLFNFYELIGDGHHNQWFYRGDSADIFADNALLHRQPDPINPQFGNRLRCTACHGAGGPIMKEVYAPHNDWWEPNRKLDFGDRKFNESILDMINNLVSPEYLSNSVKLGTKKLADNHTTQNTRDLSLQETLRPLFCPVEINFMSDMTPNDEKNPLIKLPIQFFMSKKLISNEVNDLFITRSAYENALRKTESHFPETLLSDADHAWLAPVKAISDEIAINHLIEVGLIDKKFAFDVLSMDMTNPVFSSERCHLLAYIPNKWSNHWKDEFIQQLKSANNPTARELFNRLTDASHTPEYYQDKAEKFLMYCREKLKREENVQRLFLLLAQRREEIKASEISKNRRGQILEPGFRVIFPETNADPVPGKLMLTDTCEVI
jgi:hypothetical protein